MKLRTKISVILSVAWLIALILVYLDFKFVILDYYKKLERDDIADNYKLTQEIFRRMFDTTMRLTFDWAHWDDTYYFLKNKKTNFIASNMSSVSFHDMNANFILFYDVSGKYYYGQAYDLKKDKWIDVPSDLLSEIQKSMITGYVGIIDQNFAKSGFLKIKSGYIVLSSVAITDSLKKLSPDGNIIVGYFFDNSKVQNLRIALNSYLDFISLEVADKDPILSSAKKHLASGEMYYAMPKNEKIMYIFSFIRDVNNNPIGILRLEMPRTTYLSGVNVGKRYIFVVIAIGILFLLLMWIALRIVLLDRLFKLRKNLEEVAATSDFSRSIKIGGNDELTEIAKVNNELLKIIDLTQNQLRSRLHINTEDMEELAKLNKNLTAEINKHLNLEKNLEEQEKMLQRKAYYDVITGLPNRIFFSELLSKSLLNGEREKIKIAVLFLDLDKFKNVNDTYGHDVGDMFLKHVALMMSTSLRKSDAIGRIGGDEFLFYITDIKSKEELNDIVKRILEAVKIPMIFKDNAISTSASVGISLYPEDGLEIEKLISKADAAMYYAKKQGGNTYFYHK